jgi:hypothetical protein
MWCIISKENPKEKKKEVEEASEKKNATLHTIIYQKTVEFYQKQKSFIRKKKI